MKFSGELFTFEKESNLVAFESGLVTDKTVVFIGGLGDGLNAVPYLEPLEESLTSFGWSLTQVQLSSSFNGYGTSNLQTDCQQLDALVDHLTTERGKKQIVFLGHSTGSQDCYWHNKYGQNRILGYILQAPVSDREHLEQNLDNFQENLKAAITLREQGKGLELLPRSVFWVPVTADRFYSLAAKGGDDDVFSTDLSDQEILFRFKDVNDPICWVYSENDEFYASKLPKQQVIERFQSLIPAIQTAVIVPEGDHSITKKASQDYFVSVVKDFIQKLS
ncbi:hypothetical protein G6F56_001679 [Rhizopus delemar]|uniref:Uncharacterized protein n=1 Tax=Rhizopus stolonifer TaxID=4846 RepID=A0A367IWI2_RHIST|nr:hypothetical protein G6F56_001679 [Rhizopus delemar]RCH82037.1 hypothetical protein CU098_004679 [Rhizopus stolonifer]